LGDRGQTLPPEPRQTYHILTAKLKNAKAGVYPKGKPLGFTPKGIFDKKRILANVLIALQGPFSQNPDRIYDINL